MGQSPGGNKGIELCENRNGEGMKYVLHFHTLLFRDKIRPFSFFVHLPHAHYGSQCKPAGDPQVRAGIKANPNTLIYPSLSSDYPVRRLVDRKEGQLCCIVIQWMLQE